MIFSGSSKITRGALAVFTLMALFTGFFFSVILRVNSPLVRLGVFIVPVFLLVLPFILYVRQGGNKGQTRSKAATVEKEKPKHGESLSELMSILNDEDIDDLHARVKARLEEPIDRADSDQMETFEDLLAEGEKHKNGGQRS